jgi:endonuclease/exonuclease/phosphatase (EEP) superfamily protein YafD
MPVLSRAFLSVPRRVRLPVRIALLAYLAGACLAPLWQLDAWYPAMLLTYPPRALFLVLATMLAVEGIVRGRRDRSWHVQVAGAVVAAALLWPQLDWGGGAIEPTAEHLKLLSYNVHHNTAGAVDLAREARERGVDILCLQEVRAGERPAFVEALEGYRVLWGDEHARIEHWNYGPISSLIAIRETLLGDEPPLIETAITGYRTFAVHVVVAGRPMWIVNVHTTKAFWSLSESFTLMTRARYKATWHAFEREHLLAWLDDHRGEAVVLAGDFNAPAGTRVLDLPGTQRAHVVAGEGWHRTLPAALPIWGVDHVLSAGPVHFYSYETLDLGLSDQLAQLATLSVEAPSLAAAGRAGRPTMSVARGPATGTLRRH